MARLQQRYRVTIDTLNTEEFNSFKMEKSKWLMLNELSKRLNEHVKQVESENLEIPNDMKTVELSVDIVVIDTDDLLKTLEFLRINCSGSVFKEFQRRLLGFNDLEDWISDEQFKNK